MWAALDYARDGFAVFPVVPGGKAPLTSHGWQDASTDEFIIRRWFERWPHANVGIACGRVSGVIVLDFDTKGGSKGYETLAALIGKIGEIPTPSVSTPSGGVHLYFNWSPNTPESWWKDGQLGIEYKTNGSYVLAPPSVVDYNLADPKNAGCPPTGFYTANGPLDRCRFTEVPF